MAGEPVVSFTCSYKLLEEGAPFESNFVSAVHREWGEPPVPLANRNRPCEGVAV